MLILVVIGTLLGSADATAKTEQPSAATCEAPTLTLEQAYAAADIGNLDVVIFRERLAQAEAQSYRAWTELLPDASIVAQYTRNSVNAVFDFPNPTTGQLQEIVIQPYNQFNAAGSFTMPLISMPAYYAIAAARRTAEGTQWNLTHARNELFFSIAQTYYNAVASQRLIQLSEQQVESAKEAERVAKARFDAGDLPKVGFLRAGVERARAEQDLVRSINAHQSIKLALVTLLGVNDPFCVAVPPPAEAPSTANEQELLDIAKSERKDLRASELFVSASDAQVKATWWRFAPVISLGGRYQWANLTGFTGQNDQWLVQVTASWQIFDAGLYADLDLFRSRRAESQATEDKLRRQVEQDVRTAVLDLESARANLITAKEQASLANESERLVNAQFAAGAATYLDVVDATRQQFASGVSALNEELNVQVSALRLSKAIGRYGVEKFPE